MLIQPHMEQRYLQELEKQTNPQQALQPFLPLFFPLLPSSLASLPSPDGHSCFRHVAEASVGVCTLGTKTRCSLGGNQHCSHPALLLREGKQSSKGHGRELGPASGCESQHGDAWVPLLPGVPRGHSTLTVSSCPCSPAAWERAGTGTDSVCQARTVSLARSLC